jgi:hypothetical protein
MADEWKATQPLCHTNMYNQMKNIHTRGEREKPKPFKPANSIASLSVRVRQRFEEKNNQSPQNNNSYDNTT